MYKRRYQRRIVGILTLALFAVAPVSALTESLIHYVFFSGKIAIRVETTSLRDGKYVSWEEGSLALPGGFVSCVPTVYNEGAACYIRVRADIYSERRALYPLTLSQVEGIGEGWIFRGGYFYYQNVFEEDERIILFDGIQIPEYWTSWEESGISWNISIEAEAIQAEYFTPDFQSDDPWSVQTKELQILDAEEGEVISMWDCSEGDLLFAVTSRLDEVEIGMEEQMVSLGSFLPGMRKDTSVEVYNSSGKNKEILLTVHASGDLALTKHMQVSIRWSDVSGERILFEGTLGACDGLEETISMMRRGEGSVNLTCYLPCESDNSCAAEESSIWLTLTDPSAEGFYWDGNMTTSTYIPTGSKGTEPKTGEDSSGTIWLLCLTSSGLLLGISWRKLWRMTDEKDS